jgi:hypothetical protein
VTGLLSCLTYCGYNASLSLTRNFRQQQQQQQQQQPTTNNQQPTTNNQQQTTTSTTTKITTKTIGWHIPFVDEVKNTLIQ